MRRRWLARAVVVDTRFRTVRVCLPVEFRSRICAVSMSQSKACLRVPATCQQQNRPRQRTPQLLPGEPDEGLNRDSSKCFQFRMVHAPRHAPDPQSSAIAKLSQLLVR